MLDKIDNHLRNKSLSRNEKQRDVESTKNDRNTIVAVYDLQAVLPTPTGNVSQYYYTSKLATYNFTVFNIGQKLGKCYVWHETVGKRGANELGSFVFDYSKEECRQKENVIFYSDHCCGQNKNKFVACVYLHAIKALENINRITHKFLITGHTQNEEDAMHSAIEKEKQRMLKSNAVYIPAQWVPIISLAKKTGHPYKVKQVQTTEIFDIKYLTSIIGKNFTRNTEGENIKWSDIKILKVEKMYPTTIFYKRLWTGYF